MQGYTLYDNPADADVAFTVWDGSGNCPCNVRYAATLDVTALDGTARRVGFAAWDGDSKLRIPRRKGQMLIADLDTELFFWPYRAAPKRAVSNGDERFALVTMDYAPTVAADSRVTGMVQVGPDEVLVETQDWDVPLAIWRGIPSEIRDRRLEFAAA